MERVGQGNCFIHFSSNSRSEQTLLNTTTEQILLIDQRADLWINLEQAKYPEKSIAENAKQLILSSSSISNVASSSSSSITTSATQTTATAHGAKSTADHDDQLQLETQLQHHKSCFTRFTSMSKIERAKSQKRKVSLKFIYFNYIKFIQYMVW